MLMSSGGQGHAERLSARSLAGVVFQEPVVDRGPSGLANLELHARLWVRLPDDRRWAGSTSSRSLAVVGLSALAPSAISIRAFKRSAVARARAQNLAARGCRMIRDGIGSKAYSQGL
jgi:hypothetical protein